MSKAKAIRALHTAWQFGVGAAVVEALQYYTGMIDHARAAAGDGAAVGLYILAGGIVAAAASYAKSRLVGVPEE